MNPQTTRSVNEPPSAPWWRFPMVWLVLAGPAIVVVAGIATAVIAVRGADVVVTDAPAVGAEGRTTADTPALAARNHAATAGR